MAPPHKSLRIAILWILASVACLAGLLYLAASRAREGGEGGTPRGVAPDAAAPLELPVEAPAATGEPTQQGPGPGSRWTLRGRATWQTGSAPIAHRPVAGARVRVSPAPPWPGTAPRGAARGFVPLEALADADGRYELRDVPAQVELLLEAEDAAAGYFAIRCVLPAPDGEAVRNTGDIGLEVGFPIRVVVEDGEHRPVSGARAWLTHRSTLPRGLAGLELAGQPRTFVAGAAGEYTLDHVPGRRHLLRVEAKGFAAYRLEIRPTEAAAVRVVLAAARSLRGTVLTAEGEPIPDARVRAGKGDAARETRTDIQGRFALDDVAAGVVVLRASAPGHCDEDRICTDEETELELRLAPEAVARGRVVLGADATPVAGARVHLGAGDFTPGMPHAITDAAGAFRLGGLRSATYILRAEAEGFLPRLSDTTSLAEGDGGDVIVLPLVPASTLRGRVVEARSGEGVPGAAVTVSQTRTESRPVIERRLESAADGSFSTGGLAAGSAAIEVKSADHAWARRMVELTTPQEDEILVSLEPGFELFGRVLDPDGEPLAGAAVTVEAETERGRSKPAPDLVEGKRTDATDPGGAFRFRGLSIRQRHTLRVESARFLTYWLGLAPGEAVSEPLTIRLLRGALLTVQLRDKQGQPVPRGTVRLLDRTWMLGEYEHARLEGIADEGGAVTLGPFASQETWVMASAPGRLPTVPRLVAMEDGQTVELELELATGAALRGRVLDSGGQPIDGVEVTVSHPWGAQVAHSTEDGRFALDSLPAGPHFVRASKAGFATSVARTRPEQPEVVLHLERQAQLRCRVQTAGGTAPAAATVELRSSGGDGPEVELDASGAFDELVPPGSLELVVAADGFARQELSLELRPGELRELSLELGPEGRIEGEAVDRATGERVDGCSLLLVGLAADGTRIHESEARSFRGEIELPGLPAGLYTLRPASCDGNWLGRLDNLRVAAGAATRVRLELERSRGLRGRVTRSDRGAAGVRVVARPLEGDGEQTTVTDAGGHFELDGLEEGEHDIVVVHARNTTDSRRVRVGEGFGKLDIDLEAARVHGLVIAGGVAVAGSVRIDWLSSVAPGEPLRCFTSSGKEYEIWLGTGATYELRVWRVGLALRTFLELPAGTTERHLDLELPPRPAH